MANVNSDANVLQKLREGTNLSTIPHQQILTGFNTGITYLVYRLFARAILRPSSVSL